MKPWAKGGLVGFLVAFVGLWIILLSIGSDANGWKCMTLDGPIYCSFTSFSFSFIHWAFVLFFSWVGFFGGVIDTRLITKILNNPEHAERRPLKITSTLLLTAVIVFVLISFFIFDDWVTIIIYASVFTVLILLVSWIIGKVKYR